MLCRAATRCEIRYDRCWYASGMKSKSHIVWILGAFLVIASLDAVPDPPAVNQNTDSVASRPCEARGFYEPRSNNDRSYTSSRRQPGRVAFNEHREPLPNDWIVLTGQAADPSPPILESLRHPYLHT